MRKTNAKYYAEQNRITSFRTAQDDAFCGYKNFFSNVDQESKKQRLIIRNRIAIRKTDAWGHRNSKTSHHEGTHGLKIGSNG